MVRRKSGPGHRADLLFEPEASPAVGLLDEEDDRLSPLGDPLDHLAMALLTGIHGERDGFTDGNRSFHVPRLP